MNDNRLHCENTHFESETFRFRVFANLEGDTMPHWHNHLEFVRSESGPVDVHVNGATYRLNEGDVVLVPPGSLHGIQIGESRYTAIVVGEDLLAALMPDSHLAPLVHTFCCTRTGVPVLLLVEDCLRYGLKPLLDQIVLEDRMKRRGYEAVLKARLCLLFGLLLQHRPELTAWREPYREGAIAVMKTALHYLTDHYREKVTLAEMSRQASMSVQHFCRLFKAHTGKSFMDYLTLLRLEHAYRLITETDLPITRIPEQTGFCNGNYFSRVFRSRFGTTPSAVRKQHRQAG